MQWRFVESAFKHGFDQIDFYDVFASRPRKLRGPKRLGGGVRVIWANFAGTYLFMVYRRTKHEQVVFHMSEMTDGEKKFYRRHRK